MEITVDQKVEAGYTVLPVGSYNGSVTEAKEQEGDKAYYLRIVVQVSEPGEYAGVLIFDNVMVKSKAEEAPPNFQGHLRSLVEATLGEWRNFNSDELVGCDVQVRVKHEQYEGEPQHRVKRFGYSAYGPLPDED